MRGGDLPSAGIFRPVSFHDFQCYASDLAWLLHEPARRCEELLAQAYGFAGRSALCKALREPGDPGPFDCDRVLQVDLERQEKLLECIVRHKGLAGIRDLTSRWFDARDLGLFEPPELHREQFRRVRMKVELLECDGAALAPAAQAPCSAFDYAVVGPTLSDDKEYVLRFTETGRAVFDAIRYVVGRYSWIPEAMPYSAETVIEKLDTIIRIHPDNPWARAAKVCFGAHELDSWDPDLLLRDAVKAIELFQVLYQGYASKAADNRLVTPDADTLYWPAVVFWGGVVALDCGEIALAQRWLRLNKKLAYRDSFGAGFLLQEL